MSTTVIFNSMYSALAEARASIRVGSDVLPRCLCEGVGKARQSSEMGLYGAVATQVRYLAPEAVAAGLGGKLELGAAIELSSNGAEYARFRIVGTQTTGAVVTLTLADPNE